jgi:hypothetical protein
MRVRWQLTHGRVRGSHGAPGARRSPPLGVTERAIGAYPGAAIGALAPERVRAASLASEAARVLGDDGPAHVPSERGLAIEGAQPQRSSGVRRPERAQTLLFFF